MTSLIKLHYTKTRDNVHEWSICEEKQHSLRQAAGMLIALFNNESWTRVQISYGSTWKSNGGTLRFLKFLCNLFSADTSKVARRHVLTNLAVKTTVNKKQKTK